MAYKRLIRMNMPIDKEGRVAFTTTLFALIRDNLKINVRESAEMDQVGTTLCLKIFSSNQQNIFR